MKTNEEIEKELRLILLPAELVKDLEDQIINLIFIFFNDIHLQDKKDLLEEIWNWAENYPINLEEGDIRNETIIKVVEKVKSDLQAYIKSKI